MHDRISVNSLCFPGTSFRDVGSYWRELGARRVSLLNPLLVKETVSAAQDALKTGDYQVETITHAFLYGRHLEPHEASWREEREELARLIETAKTLGARSIYMAAGGHGSLTWEQAAECFSAAIAPCADRAGDRQGRASRGGSQSGGKCR